METAKDILDRNHKQFVTEMGVSSIHPEKFPDAYSDQAIRAMQEIADKAWEAGAEYADECYCGKCSYCLEVRDEPAPDKSTFMKSLFSDTK